MNTGSVLEYALAFTSAALDKYCSKWSAAPKTGFIDITTSKDFYRIYSGLQIVRNDLLQFIFIITSHLGNISEP
jgi:cytoplasmic FMR1 interacting protein